MKFISTVLAAIAVGGAFAAIPAGASEDPIGVMSRNPTVSPSGEVVFAADYDGATSMWRLWASALDGSRLRRLAAPPKSVADEEPAWSPDGATLAFSSNDGVTSDIWAIGAGGQSTQLTSKALNNRQPAWTPDGKRIVFVSDRGGSNDLWIMNADGSGATRLTSLPGQENHPSVSPDGATVVFSQTGAGGATLMMVGIDGRNLRSLTSPVAGIDDWNPSWGRNGILFSSNRDTASEHYKIWIIQPDGAGMRKVGNVIGLDPVWTPNGKILFTDEVAAGAQLAAVSLLDPATGVKQRVIAVEGYAVGIDIRPGRTPNFIHPHNRGRVTVAILSRPGFDAVRAVKQSTLRFGRTGAENSLWRCRRSGADVDGDGRNDLLCRFSISDAGFSQGDTQGTLRFLDQNGVPYEGRDSIVTVNHDDDDDFRDED